MSNYQGRLEDSQANKLLVTPHSMANIEDSDTASQIYTVGNMLVFNNRLCKVTAAIAQGDTLEIGTNIAYKGINDIGQQLCASDGKEFYFDVKDGTYGYYPSAAKVASEFVPFGGTRDYTSVASIFGGSGKNKQLTATSTVTCGACTVIICQESYYGVQTLSGIPSAAKNVITGSTLSTWQQHITITQYDLDNLESGTVLASYHTGSDNPSGLAAYVFYK